MPITFKVDDVSPVLERLPCRPPHEAFAVQTGAQLYVLGHEPEVVVDEGNHPLLAAVQRAYAEHRPLVLSPDIVWLTLSQGFGRHVDRSGERLRERFMRHEGRAPIDVVVDHTPLTTRGWASVVERAAEGIREHLGPGVHRLLVPDFSTTTPVTRTASEAVMVSAFKRGFESRMVAACGIPRVTLEGTPEDWRTIRARVDVLAEYELAEWAEQLVPICDQLIAAAEGRPDVEFWQGICRPAQGWIARLFPHLQEGAPSGVSEAPFTLVERVAGEPDKTRAMRLFGGFVGVHQDKGGALSAEIGWALGAQASPTS